MSSQEKKANEIRNFWDTIYDISNSTDGYMKVKLTLNDFFIEHQSDTNSFIQEFSNYGLHLIEIGTRREKSPAISTIVKYVSFIKPVYLLLEGETPIRELDEFELASLFEQIQDLKGNNNDTNSGLLNLFTYLNIANKQNLSGIDLSIHPSEQVDVNLLSDDEVNKILSSDELSPEEKLFFATLYETSARNKEVYQLLGEDVDTLAEVIHLRTNRLDKMKNRFSTRYINFSRLSENTLNGLLKQKGKSKTPLFDYDPTIEKQRGIVKFCRKLNTKIKKITGRIVSLKHLRHTKPRINHLMTKKFNSLRGHMQNSALHGHSNLATTQKHYTHSVNEGNLIYPMSDDVTLNLSGPTLDTIRKRRERFRKKVQESKMTNDELNAYLCMKGRTK